MKYYDVDYFNEMLEKSIRENWDMPALTNYLTGETFTYGKMAQAIAEVHQLFQELEIEEGDKIALVGKNTPEWAIVFLATVTYGATIVPILQNFPIDDIHHIVNHSESKLLFVSDNLKEQVLEDHMRKLKCIYCYTEKYLIHQSTKKVISAKIQELRDKTSIAYPNGVQKEDIHYAKRKGDDIFALNYTSGTTGFSKGVLQTYENIRGNIGFVIEKNLAYKGNKILTFLPLAHTYGCTLDFLSQITNGSHITFLNKIPAPQILVKAFEEVKPNVVFTVPLIVEKIYRSVAEPIITKHAAFMSEEELKASIYPKVRNMMIQIFGGNFKQVIIGGAPLNAEIEESLTKLEFPFAVGYGMTECSPLISFVNLEEFVPKSVGKPLRNMDVRIDSEDAENIAGEILVKGQNITPGYYKNPTETTKTFDEDGWFHTGDIGTLSKDGYLFIKGRCKTMILGPSGQNIYPEALEAKLTNMPFVSECLIVEKEGKLIALVYPDMRAMDEINIQKEDLQGIMDENKKKFNQAVANYEQISEIILYPNEFEKTPKKNIKRYLYESHK